jgi:hypothetical protein
MRRAILLSKTFTKGCKSCFTRPDGKLTVVLMNRSFVPHTFSVDTGLQGQRFRGYRYTPESSGAQCAGVPVAELEGGIIAPQIPDMTWEFWEQVQNLDSTGELLHNSFCASERV